MIRGLIILFAFLLCSIAHSQTSLNNLLFQNTNVNNKVLTLDVAPQYDGRYFIVGLVQDNKVVAQTTHFATAGVNSYEITPSRKTTGIFNYIATTLPKEAILAKELTKPGLWEELDILNAKEIITPKVINFVTPKKFMGYNFTLLVFFFTLFSFVILKILGKQSFLTAAFISVLVGTFLIDTTNMIDQLDTYKEIESKYPKLATIASTQEFLQQIKPQLAGETWTFRGSFNDEFQKLFIKYNLADMPNFHEGIKMIPRGTLIITPDAPTADRKLVDKGKEFYLLIQQ